MADRDECRWYVRKDPALVTARVQPPKQPKHTPGMSVWSSYAQFQGCIDGWFRMEYDSQESKNVNQ